MRRYPAIFLALAAILAGCGDEATGGSPADAVAPAEVGPPSAPAGTTPTPDAAARGPEAGPPDAGTAGPTDTTALPTAPSSRAASSW